MSAYPFLLIGHLLAALMFIGTVFFEVLMLEPVRRHLPAATMVRVERAVADRASRLMPWVLALLYGSGLGMAWHYRAALAHPLDSAFGLMLACKIVLALSVFGHFLVAMVLRGRRRLGSVGFRRLHLSLFAHMLAIVVLAKAMFYLGG